MSYGYRTHRQPDRQLMFAVRFHDGSSGYFRVPKNVGAFGVTPAVVRLAHEAQARGEMQTGEIAKIERVR